MNRGSSRLPVGLLVICYWVVSAVPTSEAKKHPAYEDPEGYALLSLALLRAVPDPQNSAIYITWRTNAEENGGAFSLEKCAKWPPEFREAADDYLRKAKVSYTLREKFTLGASYAVVPGGSDLFKAKSMGNKKNIGIFEVSAVGFDPPRTRAVLRVNNVCGALCGGSDYYFFVKGKNRWQEVKGISKCNWVY